MRIGWAMQISPGGQAGEKSGKDATPGHTVAAVYDRRTRLSKNLPPSTGKMPVGPTGKMPVLRSFFARRDFLRNSAGAHFHHELSRCHVFLVFLVATDLGRIEAPLR